jgi:hypothetical protein
VVLRVLGVQEVGEQARLGGAHVVLLQLLHHRRELRRRQLGDPAAVALLEAPREVQGFAKGALDGGVVGRAVELGQVPADVLGAGLLGDCLCHMSG